MFPEVMWKRLEGHRVCFTSIMSPFLTNRGCEIKVELAAENHTVWGNHPNGSFFYGRPSISLPSFSRDCSFLETVGYFADLWILPRLGNVLSLLMGSVEYAIHSWIIA